VVANGARALVLGHGVSVRESEIREREKKERKIGEAAGVAGEKKKERKRRVGSTRPGLF
jgi:hypothetical protein